MNNTLQKITIATLLASVFLWTGCKKSETDPIQTIESMNISGMTWPVKNISISIDRPKNDVYEFASNPENFPKWLAMVTSMTEKSNGVWIAQTESGEIEIEFCPKNSFGVIDYLVKLPGGSLIDNPLRIIENKKGSEVIFTLFKLPNKSDADFDADAKLVQADLKKLKEIMESGR